MSSPILLLLLIAGGAAQSTNFPDGNETQMTFRPSIAVVIGIFSVMFSLTFLLLMYAKFCHTSAARFLSTTGGIFTSIGQRAESEERVSGVDRAVIASLPVFHFSALKGAREGLECAVCLSRFADADVLRLLPSCKHAFHTACIDRWLERHSSCPLCRARVEVDDVAFFPHAGARDAAEQGAVELTVERERGGVGTSGRLRAVFAGKRGGLLHSYKHRVNVSDAVFRSRWSDFNSADLIGLDCEMLRVMSSRRFECAGDAGGRGGVSADGVSRMKEEMERKRRLERKAVEMQIVSEEHSEDGLRGDMRSLISPGSRCMSDITEVARYRSSRGHGGKDENVRRMWLPIARRTVQLFAGKERRSVMPQSLRGAGESM